MLIVEIITKPHPQNKTNFYQEIQGVSKQLHTAEMSVVVITTGMSLGAGDDVNSGDYHQGQEKQKGKCRFYINWKPRSEEIPQKIKSGS